MRKKEKEVLHFEPEENSNIFKKWYEKLVQLLVYQLPPAPNKFNMEATKAFYDRMNISNTFKLEEVGQEIIQNLRKKTNINKAPGIDKLTGISIKDGADILAGLLTQIINLLIKYSTFPYPCKIAKFKALFTPPYLQNIWKGDTCSNWTFSRNKQYII